ncbi:response regulator [Terrimonas pollutisoli]|uniref:response regulator n=1 Tax=Terrimonas pollutisoli TaxID=3034147 RepID=UPI0023ED7746|nr:response regulator [Terrimonas sp. H1YJ31]
MISNFDFIKHSILYADDDPDDLMIVKDAFEKYAENIELLTANDGVEAIQYLKSLSPIEPAPCLIILDINMPRMNGKEALKELRSMDRFKHTPVVLFTTSSLPDDREFALKYNAGFITKPLDFRQVSIIADAFVEHCTDEIKRKIIKKIM